MAIGTWPVSVDIRPHVAELGEIWSSLDGSHAEITPTLPWGAILGYKLSKWGLSVHMSAGGEYFQEYVVDAFGALPVSQ